MDRVATAVSHSFDNSEDDTCSQCVPYNSTQSLRCKYLQCVNDATLLRTFLQQCSEQLNASLIDSVQIASSTVSFWCPDDDTYEHVSFGNGFRTIGRKGDVCVNKAHSSVSRVHALMCLVQHEDGRQLLVVLDWWSLYGTAIAGTTHQSVPNDYCVLIVPVKQPVVLQLGVLDMAIPLSITVNAPECLICHERPRTELFETCRHLVACRSCCYEMSRCSIVTDCPVCRSPISVQTTRMAQYELGECQTYNIQNTKNYPKHLDEEMDALQSTLHS